MRFLGFSELARLYIAPDLIVPETCNSAWLKYRRGEASTAQVRNCPRRIAELIAQFVPSPTLAPRAAEIGLLLDHPVYDCFYLALAESRDLELLTADRRLTKKLAGTQWQSLPRELEPD